MMVVGGSCDDAGAELVGLGVGQFQGRDLLQMVVQKPGVVDQNLQDQGFPAGDGAALAPHDRARSELRARRLVGAGGERGGDRAAATAAGAGESIRGPARLKAAAGLRSEIAAACKAAAPAFGSKGALQARREVLAIVA